MYDDEGGTRRAAGGGDDGAPAIGGGAAQLQAAVSHPARDQRGEGDHAPEAQGLRCALEGDRPSELCSELYSSEAKMTARCALTTPAPRLPSGAGPAGPD